MSKGAHDPAQPVSPEDALWGECLGVPALISFIFPNHLRSQATTNGNRQKTTVKSAVVFHLRH